MFAYIYHCNIIPIIYIVIFIYSSRYVYKMMDKKKYLMVHLILLSILHYAPAQTIQDATALYDELTKDYNMHIRPVEDQSKPVVVNMTFDLVSIREMDEISGKLSIVGIMWMSWEEPRMRWNPTSYNNTFSIKVPNYKVWKPDLVIAHPIETIKSVGYHHEWYPVQYYYNGVAIWAPGDVMTTTCSIDVTYYPFDTQNCEIMFLPWGSVANEIHFHVTGKEVSRNFFTENGEWSLEKATAASGLISDTYPVYTISLKLKRRPTFIVVNVVLPVLFMGMLNVLVFFLPAKSGERVSYSITVLLAIAVFLTLVGDNMPKTSQPMSTICYFLLTNLVLSSLIMIVTLLNLRLYHRDKQIPVPGWLVSFALIVNCKRQITLTKIEKTNEPDTNSKDEKCQEQKSLPVKWATPFFMDERGNYVTWRDVSSAVDIVCGTLSILWLFITAVSFFVMVSTQNVPGTEN